MKSNGGEGREKEGSGLGEKYRKQSENKWYESRAESIATDR